IYRKTNNEAKLHNKPKTKVKNQKFFIYYLEELNKVIIVYSFTFLYVEKTFKDFKKKA
ncbi:hypothetical protein H8356DRAFT_936176, partial [Neocallimastix lanati (nom. inval.)]